VKFKWDSRKAESNVVKHGVSFDEAATVFNDPLALTFEDRAYSHAEHRYLTFGLSSAQTPLVVCHTDRGDNIRVLSARRMTPKERRDYEQYR
jgi:uncharacterized DUF497 family protein